MRIHINNVYSGEDSGGLDMYRRLNVTLPVDTVRLIDRVARRGSRSRLIDRAVRRYVEDLGRANLKKRLRAGAVERAERDLQIAQEWFELDEALWQKRPK